MQSNQMKEKYATGELTIWCAGKKLSKEHRLNLSKAHKGISGERHPQWKGGKPYTSDAKTGYLIQWNGPNKKIYQHRKVMEEHLGRKLKKGEVVHHKDGNPANNSIENLMLFANEREHMAYHASIKTEYRNQYGVFERKVK